MGTSVTEGAATAAYVIAYECNRHRLAVAILMNTRACAHVPPTGARRGHGRPASPGAAGLGDRLFPTLGNGGYDVWHYDVAWRYPTAAPTTPVTGTVTIDAKATQSLSSFDLDWAGTSYGAVAVKGRPAAVVQDGEDIVITPEKPIHKGARFRVVVAGYTATPTAVDPENDASTAFFSTPDGTATAAQPNPAHLFLPSNDRPRDKATFTFHLDVPDGVTAVANGDLVSRRRPSRAGPWELRPAPADGDRARPGRRRRLRRHPSAAPWTASPSAT
jgi:hypothetical protein